mmetsp:Transcript_3055/g.6129  ORF Transcript_3055/g.6129 Transcript_3055/m.6129 type:complete len:439 (+) Transcript_3055:411-1727(+)
MVDAQLEELGVVEAEDQMEFDEFLMLMKWILAKRVKEVTSVPGDQYYDWREDETTMNPLGEMTLEAERPRSAGAVRLGLVPKDAQSESAHDEWCRKLWKRMDRDRDGYITRAELNCQEFQDVLKSVLAPEAPVSTAVTYARAEENVQQVLHYCIRKADCNKHGHLSYEEFRALIRVLRNESLAKHTALLVFSLFDLDNNEMIDKAEFREIYRFFLGNVPAEPRFLEDWNLLDKNMEKKVSLSQFVEWLRVTKNPIFRQHALPVEGDPGGNELTRKPKKAATDPMDRMLEAYQKKRTRLRPLWNGNFAPKPPEPGRPKAFSRPQSLPELKMFYSRKPGYEAQKTKMSSPMPPAIFPKLDRAKHSLDAGLPLFLPDRCSPGGTMRRERGDHRRAPWVDAWQTPPSVPGQRISPGSLQLKCPGKAPPSILFGRDAENMELE